MRRSLDVLETGSTGIGSRLNRTRQAGLTIAALAGTLGLATAVVALLEGTLGVADASPVYLVPVVVAGVRHGLWPALATALIAFLVYDFLFTEPRLTLIVADPREWLDLVVVLFVAIVVGRLAALGREHAAEAARRARESTALFAMSRLLATEPDLDVAASRVVARLVAETGLERAWISLDRAGSPRILADTRAGVPIPRSTIASTLRRTPGDEPAQWVRAHEPGLAGREEPARKAIGGDTELLRIRLDAEGRPIGWLHAERRRQRARPPTAQTRILALAADQLALALRREELRREATTAEIARESDAMRSALLDAVSHDLRTPLASIRAAAGSLVDADVVPSAEAARQAGASIELEAIRLDRLVRDVLDVGRIEGGGLRPSFEALDVRDMVEQSVERLRPLLGERPIRIDVPDDAPPVQADAALLDAILGNVLENAARYAPPPATVAVTATSVNSTVTLLIDDAGPGVAAAARSRLFEKFFRVGDPRGGSRHGLGLGLAVVRGLAEGMGGSVSAEASPLGGLRIRLTLPVAAERPGETP